MSRIRINIKSNTAIVETDTVFVSTYLRGPKGNDGVGITRQEYLLPSVFTHTVLQSVHQKTFITNLILVSSNGEIVEAKYSLNQNQDLTIESNINLHNSKLILL
jgi:hypothetical protein